MRQEEYCDNFTQCHQIKEKLGNFPFEIFNIVSGWFFLSIFHLLGIVPLSEYKWKWWQRCHCSDTFYFVQWFTFVLSFSLCFHFYFSIHGKKPWYGNLVCVAQPNVYMEEKFLLLVLFVIMWTANFSDGKPFGMREDEEEKIK